MTVFQVSAAERSPGQAVPVGAGALHHHRVEAPLGNDRDQRGQRQRVGERPKSSWLSTRAASRV